MKFLSAFPGRAAAGCLLAAGSTFLPWMIVPVMGLQLHALGIRTAPGKIVCGLSIALALLFIFTRAEKTVALWKPLVLVTAAVALGLFCFWQGTSGLNFEERFAIDGDVTILQRRADPGFGLYVTGAMAAALLGLGATEFRRYLHEGS